MCDQSFYTKKMQIQHLFLEKKQQLSLYYKRDRDRETDRKTEKQTERERERKKTEKGQL